MPRRRRAFTMIELLVVIGIIVLLLAILMPALSRAREAANAVTCSSHVRTLTQAFLLFANDNNGHFPGTRRAWRVDYTNPSHWDWLFGEYAAYDEYPPNTVVERVNCGPQYGTIFKYVNNAYNVYLCPSLNVERMGSGIGSNGRFDYAAFSVFCGASIHSIRPISQLHHPCAINKYSYNSSGQVTGIQNYPPLLGINTSTDPNVTQDPMTPTYSNLGYSTIVENLPTPIICQEEPSLTINSYHGGQGNPFTASSDPNDDDWWSEMDGAHCHWDQMAHCHSGGSYYGAIDGSVVFVIEPDTDQSPGNWGANNVHTGLYGEGSSLWWQKSPSRNIPMQLNVDPGALQTGVNTWVPGWNWWSTQ